MGKSRIDDFEALHGVHRNSQGEDGRGRIIELNDHQHGRLIAHRSGTMAQFAVASRQFWSPPKEISPGPISTRVPSIDSTNQRPDSGTIHCGLGFSCQAPIQPTG